MTTSNLIQLANTIIPIMRMDIPNLIARFVAGVQPMTELTGSIFGLKPKSSKKALFNMHNNYYRWFLRLNNRKTHHTVDEIIKNNYPLIELTKNQFYSRQEIYKWCDQNIGEYRWAHNGYNQLTFCDEKYIVLFKLVWSEE